MEHNQMQVGPIIGRRLKKLRTTHPLSQDELAALMRTHGISWTRAAVVNLESGGRAAVDVEELLALCSIFGVAPAEWLKVEPGTTLSKKEARALKEGRNILSGKAVSQSVSTKPRKRAEVISEESQTDAVKKAAYKLNAQPADVARAAVELWSRGFTEERDRRQAERAEEQVSTRSRQALRGHITRQMLQELEPIVNNNKRRKTK